ncbi:MAG: homocysteine S-methyltransferase family protein [Deltaproteobacteria bacterium]|nr:homocysteine S-methyltransferase family protein [Deltaproteobacteria bacterium]
MTRHRDRLPQLGTELFLTDGGLETTLVFLEGHELPCFAAFDLLKRDGGPEALRKYFRSYAALARAYGVGLVLETATWRANPDWAEKIGYDAAALAEANRQAVALVEDVRRDYDDPHTPVVVSGCIGPRGDGYRPDAFMREDEAEQYHATQARVLADAGADLISAITMTYAEEAIGVTRAARAAGMPVAISFTVETDGRLPSGETLAAAIARTDAATDAAPAYYMINCAHPTHFADALEDGDWLTRLRGIRANASTKSHAELDAATELDIGSPSELGVHYKVLRRRLPHLTILGGCCGTDQRHIEAIAKACTQS